VTVVVAAAIIQRDGRFLVTKRPAGVHLEGYWEFPGGKCEPGELIAECLSRELREELDLEVEIGEELFTTAHVYPDRAVELHFLTCIPRNAPRPQLSQEMRWVRADELTSLRFPPADAALIELLLRGPSG
jgi:8-oxo-dGTP diphosphatase